MCVVIWIRNEDTLYFLRGFLNISFVHAALVVSAWTGCKYSKNIQKCEKSKISPIYYTNQENVAKNKYMKGEKTKE